MLEEWKLDIEKCKSLKELLAYRNYCKFECMDSVRKIKVLEAKEEKYRQQIHKIDQILEKCTSKQKLIMSLAPIPEKNSKSYYLVEKPERKLYYFKLFEFLIWR